MKVWFVFEYVAKEFRTIGCYDNEQKARDKASELLVEGHISLVKEDEL